MRWDDGTRPYPEWEPTMPDPGIYECCGGVAAYGHIRRRHMWNRALAVVFGLVFAGIFGVLLYAAVTTP